MGKDENGQWASRRAGVEAGGQGGRGTRSSSCLHSEITLAGQKLCVSTSSV